MKKTFLATLLALSLTGPSLAAGHGDTPAPVPQAPQVQPVANPDAAIHVVFLFFAAIGVLAR
jgi:hypothetical protein